MHEHQAHPIERHGVLGATDPAALHVQLAHLNEARLQPAQPSPGWAERLEWMHARSLLEGQFLERERRAVADRAARAPRDPDRFAAWFDALVDDGPGQHDPLFDHLAEHASHEQMRWFLTQELATEAGFDDLVALTQRRMPTRVKLELARNYWDEMGRGRARGMHGPMLDQLAEELGVISGPIGSVVWEALAVSNTLMGLAYNRRYAYHAIGALGAIELTAPSRAEKLVEGLDRLGVERTASHYFRLHAVVDLRHAQTWRDEVLVPLVRRDPDLAEPIAQGTLMRLVAGARTFARYRRHLGVPDPSPDH